MGTLPEIFDNFGDWWANQSIIVKILFPIVFIAVLILFIIVLIAIHEWVINSLG